MSATIAFHLCLYLLWNAQLVRKDSFSVCNAIWTQGNSGPEKRVITECLESLKSLHSLESLEMVRFPFLHTVGASRICRISRSLESLEKGLFWKDPFSKTPLFRSWAIRAFLSCMTCLRLTKIDNKKTDRHRQKLTEICWEPPQHSKRMRDESRERKEHRKKKRVNKIFTGLSRDFGGNFVYVLFLPHKEGPETKKNT